MAQIIKYVNESRGVDRIRFLGLYVFLIKIIRSSKVVEWYRSEVKSLQYMKDHKDLDVWKESIFLTENIYALTKMVPSEEKYGLTS